jgi:hypothetical protein
MNSIRAQEIRKLNIELTGKDITLLKDVLGFAIAHINNSRDIRDASVIKGEREMFCEGLIEAVRKAGEGRLAQ